MTRILLVGVDVDDRRPADAEPIVQAVCSQCDMCLFSGFALVVRPPVDMSVLRPSQACRYERLTKHQ